MTENGNPDNVVAPDNSLIPYPDDPFEMRSGPFYLRKNFDGSTGVFLKVGHNQCNTNMVAHGGLRMTLADLSVCYEAVKGFPNLRALTVSLTANFLLPASKGSQLCAFPRVNYRTRRTAFVESKIMKEDKCIFTCSSIIRVLPAG